MADGTIKPADVFMHPAKTAEERKRTPVYSGPVRYFPAALELVARLCKAGNDKHNPGQPMHHSRGKSMDHADCLVRHQMTVGTIDDEVGLDHAVHVAWRALAQLQELAETKYGWPLAPGALVSGEPEEKTTQFKAGNRVLVVADRHADTPKHIGKKGTAVSKLDIDSPYDGDGDVWVEMDDGHYTYFHPDDIRRI